MNTHSNTLNPFPGLRPFRQDEDYLFFGREEQTMELLQRLGTHRFVAVVGTSGSGKSSLVRCGLLSELLGGKLLRAGASWEVAVTHPGGNPLALLTEAILEADLYDRHEEHAREHLLATLSRSQFGLVEAVKQARLGPDTNFLLVVDQFEEIFRFHEAGQAQQEAANEFVSLLLEAVAQAEVPIYVVLTMRSDFIGDCGQFEGLAEMVNRGEFLIPRLSRDQFKRVIEAPIKVAGGQITPRLLQRLLNDLGQQADQLPCLQHALMRTWSVWSECGESEALDLDDYQRVGRMSEALSLHADEIYASLESDRQRELCAGMFKALTVQESESRGIRRPQRLGALCQILEVPSGELCPIIEAFRRQSVTFLMPPAEVELTDKTIIDISHESLMRVWTRLRRWVEEEAQAVGIYRRLSESATLHDQNKAGLYRDPELAIALAWREANRPNQAWAERYHPGFLHAMEFLGASQQAHLAQEQAHEAARQRELEQARMLAESQRARAETETRSARRLRVLLAGAAVIALIAIGASLVAVNFWRDADTARLAAQLSERSAKQNAVSAQKEAQRAALQEAAAKVARGDAEENLARARGAIDDYMTKVSESQLLATPGLQPLRAELLASASQFYEDILKKDPNNPDLQAGLAAAFFRVGFVRWDTGDLEQSQQALERAVQFYTSALAAQPDNPELKHGLANCWFTLSAVNMLSGDSTRSNDDAKRAARIWEDLIQKGGKDLRFHKELARAYNIMGINYSQAGRPEEGFLAYQKSLSIRLSLIAEHPDDVQLVHGLAESLNNMALQVADPKLRLQMHLRGIEYAERAHQLSPQNVEYASDLSGFYSLAAGLLAARGRHAEAQALYRRDLEHLANFVRGNPSVPHMRRLFPNLVSRIGQPATGNAVSASYVPLIRDCAVASAGLPQETAEDHFIDAQVQGICAARLVAAWRQGSQRALTTAETKELDALRERGIEALRLAIAAGFKDEQRLEQDPSLASLRQHGKYPQLVAQLKEAAGKIADAPATGAAKRTASEAELAQINQDRATGYLAFGVIETSLSRAEQAAKSLDQALALRQTLAAAAPDDKSLQADLAGAREALAGLYWKTGRLAESRELFQQRIKELEQQVQKQPGDPAADPTAAAQAAAITDLAAVERELADSLAAAGLWDEATPHYAQALNWSRKPKASQPDQETQEIVAPLLWLLENTDKSYPAACEQALAQYSPASFSEHAARVARLCALSPQAVADWTPVLALTEKAQDSWHAYTRGLVLYRLGRFDEAIRNIDDARRKRQIVGVGVEDFVLAMAHFQAGRPEQARTILATANRRTPRNMGAWTHESHNMLDVDWLVLRREANQLIHGSPYGVDDRQRRGQAYMQLRDFEKAQAEWTAVIAALPDDPHSRFALARVLWETGRKEQAAQALDQARQVLSAQGTAPARDVEFWRTCAETCRLLERRDDAIEALRRAVAAQSLLVIRAPQQNIPRLLLVRLHNELIQSLQAAGHAAEAAEARREQEAFHAAFGLPPVIESATDLLADSGQRTATPDASLAAIERLIVVRQKSAQENDLVSLNLLGRLYRRRAEVLQISGRSENEIHEAIFAARGQFEQLLAADPRNANAADGLADLLLVRSTWTLLRPSEAMSQGGEQLSIEKDGSVFVSGPDPRRAVYTLKIRTELPALAAIRLETLPDARLPLGGAGRFPGNGNFHLAELTAAILPDKSDGKPRPIEITSIMVDEQGGNLLNPRNIIDGNPQTYWDTYPRHLAPHWMMGGLSSPVQIDGGSMSITLDSGFSSWGKHGLGHFRLSATDAPGAYEREQQRLAALKLSDPWAKLSAAYVLAGESERAADLLAKSGENDGIATLLEGGLSIDGVLDSLQARHPDVYANVLPFAANIAAERGKVDQARGIYGRLVKLQPDNELYKERTRQLERRALAVWNFDTGLGSWGSAQNCELSVQEGVLTARTTGSDPFFSTPASGPAGGKAMVLRYRTDQAFTMQVFWADATGGFGESRHLDYPVPTSAGEWREIALPFSCQGTLKALRLDPNTSSEHPLEIDSALLRHLEPADYARLQAEVGMEPELARLTRDIEADPMSAAKYYARGTFQCQGGRWREAAEDFARSVQLNPQSRFGWFATANCLLLAGDEEAYRQHCRAMLAQFKDPSEAAVADSTCKTCLLRTGAVELAELPVQKLRDAADAKDERYQHWYIAGCALVSYRAGHYEEVIAWTKKHPNLVGNSGALALVVRALAEHQLGQADQARQTLAQAETMIPAALRTLGTPDYRGRLPVPPAAVAADWLAPEILRREAVALIKPTPAAEK